MLINITMGGRIEYVTIVTLDMVVVHCTHGWLALLSSNDPKEVISCEQTQSPSLLWNNHRHYYHGCNNVTLYKMEFIT